MLSAEDITLKIVKIEPSLIANTNFRRLYIMKTEVLNVLVI